MYFKDILLAEYIGHCFPIQASSQKETPYIHQSRNNFVVCEDISGNNEIHAFT